MTYDGSKTAAGVKIYVNGVNKALTVNSDTLTGTTNNSFAFSIGETIYNTAFATMLVDELAIWSVAIAQSDVTSIYNSGTPTNLKTQAQSANLLSWWRMGDGTGDTTGSVVDQQGLVNLTGTSVTFSSSVP